MAPCKRCEHYREYQRCEYCGMTGPEIAAEEQREHAWKEDRGLLRRER